MSRNYVKVNTKVVAALGKENLRAQLPDGNYALWWSDLRDPALGEGSLLPEAVERTLRNIGGVVLTGSQLRTEQHPPEGYEPVALPRAGWVKFRMPGDGGETAGEESSLRSDHDAESESEEGGEA